MFMFSTSIPIPLTPAVAIKIILISLSFFSENAQYLTEGKTVEAIILYTFLQKSSVFFI